MSLADMSASSSVEELVARCQTARWYIQQAQDRVTDAETARLLRTADDVLVQRVELMPSAWKGKSAHVVGGKGIPWTPGEGDALGKGGKHGKGKRAAEILGVERERSRSPVPEWVARSRSPVPEWVAVAGGDLQPVTPPDSAADA